MNWKRELQAAVKEDKVALGTKEVLKNLKQSNGRMVVLSDSCPESRTIVSYAEMADIPIYEFPGDGFDLGATVKKPFSVSVVLVK